MQAWKNLNLPNCPTLHATQASSVVMAESARMSVLSVPSRTFEPAVRPGAGRGADAQQDVGGKEPAEQHDFGREKKPDAELGVVKAGVRPGLNCVGNFHELNQCAVEILGAGKPSGGSFCGVKSVAWPGTLYS